MIIQLDITKENTELVSSNETTCYVIGIGETDYTIHRDAKEINAMYSDKYGWFSGINIHDYHVFESRIKSIAGGIKWKDVFKYDDKNYKINSAYLGIHNKCKIIYNEGRRKVIDHLTFDGLNISEVEGELKYVIDATEI